MCVQNSKSNTILNFSILDIIIVIAVILVVFIVVTEGDLEGIIADFCNTVTVSCPLHALVTSEPN